MKPVRNAYQSASPRLASISWAEVSARNLRAGHRLEEILRIGEFLPNRRGTVVLARCHSAEPCCMRTEHHRAHQAYSEGAAESAKQHNRRGGDADTACRRTAVCAATNVVRFAMPIPIPMAMPLTITATNPLQLRHDKQSA